MGNNFTFSDSATEMERQEKQGELLIELKESVAHVMESYEDPSGITQQDRVTEMRASHADNQTREQKVSEVEELIRFGSFAQPAPAASQAYDPFAVAPVSASAAYDPFAQQQVDPFAMAPAPAVYDPFAQQGNPFSDPIPAAQLPTAG